MNSSKNLKRVASSLGDISNDAEDDLEQERSILSAPSSRHRSAPPAKSTSASSSSSSAAIAFEKNKRPGAPSHLEWSDEMFAAAEVLDHCLVDDITNLVMQYLSPELPRCVLVNKFRSTAKTKQMGPEGLAVWQGCLLIADSKTGRIRIYQATTGQFLRTFSAAQAYSITVAHGIVFTTQHYNPGISLYKFSDGEFQDRWGSPFENRPWHPVGLASKDHLLYVVDDSNRCVFEFEFDGSLLRSLCGGGQLHRPTDIAIHRDLAYVCDQTRLVVFSLSSNAILRFIPTHEMGFGQPHCTMGDGWIAVSTNYEGVSLFSTVDGTRLRSFRNGEQHRGSFICWDSSLRLLFVGDPYNDRVVSYK